MSLSTSKAMILTYHAIESGPAPLCVAPELFEAHLSVLDGAGLLPITVAALGERLLSGTLSERTVALTFDDGFASVAERAAPLLAKRGWPATVYAVADHLGGTNDWPSQPPTAPRRRLATAEQLAELAGLGWEIGSHGTTHPPLPRVVPAVLTREIADSQSMLEQLIGVPVTSFAYPYGLVPSPAGLAIVRRCYATACTGTISRIRPDGDRHLLPRIDAHYGRSPVLLRRVATGGFDGYLRGRRVAARVRRMAAPDYSQAAS